MERANPLRSLLQIAGVAAACAPGSAQRVDDSGDASRPTARLVWEEMTSNAGYPPSYNFPVHVATDGRFVLLHSEGTWISRDARRWERGALPWSGMNSAYLKYIHHAGSTWVLGTLRGNYEQFGVDPLIRRTSTYESWETVGRSATLPQLVFYGAASFRGAMWLIGGYNRERRETAEVWQSSDGLSWRQVLAQAPWSPRASPGVVVFRNRLYLIGGGRIDGPQANDVWSTEDGITWRRETDRMTADGSGGTAVAFADRLWMVGANRSGAFSSAVIVSEDGRTWTPQSAPWTPRGGVAVWVSGDSLYMTGGKYSRVEGGETVFIYSNDVWRMRESGR